MAKRTPKQVTFSQAVTGWRLSADARHLSHNTITEYSRTFDYFSEYLENDAPLGEITVEDIQEFLASRTVSKKTCRNYYIGLSALWTWAVDNDLVEKHIVRRVVPPKPEKRDIVPFTEADLRAMLAAVGTSRSYSRPGKRECAHSLNQADQHRAIILLLLDTGIRAQELTTIRFRDIDMRNTRLRVLGKGTKERTIPFSARTGNAIWKYVSMDRKDARIDEFLFVTRRGNPFDDDRLGKIIAHIGKRAGVNNAHPHRFRHTFAINYLRNGGDPYTLQILLGHASMETVKIYLRISKQDLDARHRIASPVDNWKL